MKPREVREAAAEVIRRCEDAARLIEEFCARVRRGDDEGGAAFCREREEILGAIAALGATAEPDPSDPETAERHRADRARAIRRILELDRELIGLLEARKAGVRAEMEDLRRGRRSLGSYRGPVAASPAFVDRLG